MPGPDEQWPVTQAFMLRAGGLPLDTAERLCSPGAAAWAQRLLALEDQLEQYRDPAGDALEAAVGGTDDDRARRSFLALRRDIHNGRTPRDPQAALQLVATLGEFGPDPEQVQAVQAWLELRLEHRDLTSAGTDLLAEEIETSREQLREIAGDARLRNGLLLASPTLDRHMGAFVDAPPGRLNKQARRIKRTLLEYVYRTACKTSPFSTLGTVAIGDFGDTPDGSALYAEGIDGSWRSHPRLNIAALVRIVEGLMADPELSVDLPVEVTAGWQADERRIRYVRRTRLSGSDDAAMALDSLREDLFYLSHGAVLKEVLAVLGEFPRMRLGELAQRLHAVDPERRGAPEIAGYLRRLLRLSLLTVPQLRIDIHSDDPLGTLRDNVRRLDCPWSDRLASRLDTLHELVDGYRTAPVAERRATGERIRSELTEAQEDLGFEEPRTPRTVLYEDVALPGARVVADRQQWQRHLLPSLRGLTRILPLFDMMFPHRLALKGYFLARHGHGGRCDDMLLFLHEFQRDFHDQFSKAGQQWRAFNEDGSYNRQLNWLRLPEIRALDTARTELVDRMRKAYARLEEGEELVLDDEFIDAVAGELPDYGTDFDPRGFFLQVADDGGRPLGVLNRAYSGLTLLFSRFAHCFRAGADPADTAGADDLVDRLRQELARIQPEGAVFAELTGGFDTTNLNLHPPVTPYELLCPGDVSSRPEEARIPIDDLSVVHDAATDRVQLRSRSLDVEVIPVYLGFLLPLALPEIQRGLLLFSHASMAPLPLWDGVDEPLRDKAIGGHPRVRYRDLVLVRQTWKSHPDRLPRRDRAESDAAWFLDWQRWRRQHHIPRRVFAMIDTEPLEETAEAPDRPDAGGGRKPQYVDFDSHASLTLLDHLVVGAGRRVVMQEMLPTPEQLWLRTEEGAFVTEQTVEITRTSRDHLPDTAAPRSVAAAEGSPR